MDLEQKADTQFDLNTITIGSDRSGAEYQYNYELNGDIDLSALNNLAQSVTIGSNGIGANIINGGSIGPGLYTTTTTGTGGYNWNIGAAPTTISQSGRMTLQGENADIEINGKSMSEWMTKVEERLNILVPNPELEKEWDELRRLGQRYRKLEKKCQEKSEMWRQLKKMPAPRPPRA